MNIHTDPQTKKRYNISDNPGYIGCQMLQESGQITEVQSLAQLEVLTDTGAKLLIPVAEEPSAYVYPGLKDDTRAMFHHDKMRAKWLGIKSAFNK